MQAHDNLPVGRLKASLHGPDDLHVVARLLHVKAGQTEIALMRAVAAASSIVAATAGNRNAIGRRQNRRDRAGQLPFLRSRG